jgi:hypothetical protein
MQPERTDPERTTFSDADAWIVARAAADYAAEVAKFAVGDLEEFAGSHEARATQLGDAATALRHAHEVAAALERLLCSPPAELVPLSPGRPAGPAS